MHEEQIATLTEAITQIAGGVVADPRWQNANDELATQTLVMLMYGFALAEGRFVWGLSVQDIGEAVKRVVTEELGKHPTYAEQIVKEAQASAFSKRHHPGQHELIGVGQQYIGGASPDLVHALIDNVFENIGSLRRRA